ncbi:hypothetical protein C1X59_29495 [Pseudomonas sp. FW215-R2]|nr:hypothetical protein CP336_04365 [Pseudomonas fluorescens]PMW93698.1 hypothetical protein C1X59_29495 [Pseudomonas sp. FW215-R2]PMX08311.1 hypothetical protein C1X60_17545 [Pseudomonas sp. FW215-L1]PMX16158.1 hypothetical protein C1X57_29370 [Pseudomonas sp. FW215-E1]PNA20755.1 hypothetical protein C1X58_29445 [Pseudomonas sp. FW215-R4]
MGYLMLPDRDASESDASSLSGENDITMSYTSFNQMCLNDAALAATAVERLDFADLQFRNRP